MKKFLPILVLITLVLPIVTVAQVTTPLLPTNVDLLDMIAQIANYLFWILLAISIVVIVYAGILFVTASGSAEQVEKARGIILYTVIGFFIILLARGFVELLQTIL